MGKSNYTEEEVKNIIDLTYGFAMADWSVPSYDLHDYILHLQKEGKDNDAMKKEGNADSLYHKFHNPDSQSPDPVSDTLQEGDWFYGTEEQYFQVLKMEDANTADFYIKFFQGKNAMAYNSDDMIEITNEGDILKTQLTPEEFIRRAENTFKPVPPKLKYITDGKDPH
jgi:hypothetical protein